MTRAKNTFEPGSSTYACAFCGRGTRDTGDNGQCRLCPECYELAGYENMLSDHGPLSENDKRTVRAYLAELATKIGDRAYELHPELVAEIGLVAAETDAAIAYAKARPFPAPNAPVPMDSDLVTYLVTITGPDVELLMAVDAKCSYHARRVAKRTVKAERSIDDLSFNARKA